jgi:chromosome segregation ATPase
VGRLNGVWVPGIPICKGETAMMKKFLVVAAIVVVGVVVAKKTHAWTCARDMVKNALADKEREKSRTQELAEAKKKIAAMDKGYQKLLRSIAEKMVSVKTLTEEIKTAEVNRKELFDGLTGLTESIEAKETPISYKGESYPTPAKAEAKANRELTLLKQLDKSLGSKKKLLEAEQRTLDALKDGLDKLVTQKRTFEVRVAELEAREAELQAAKIQSPTKIDEGEVADIKKLLDRVEHGQAVDTTVGDLEKQYGSKIDTSTAGVEQSSSGTVVQDFQAYRDGNQNKKSGKDTKVAQGQK